MRSAVEAIRRSGARPRPISQLPQTATSAISAPPVISSVSTTPRRLPDEALLVRPTMMTAGPGGRIPLADAVPLGETRRQAARTVGDPLTVTSNGCPDGASLLSLADAWCQDRPAMPWTTVSSAAAVGELDVSGPDWPPSSEA